MLRNKLICLWNQNTHANSYSCWTFVAVVVQCLTEFQNHVNKRHLPTRLRRHIARICIMYARMLGEPCDTNSACNFPRIPASIPCANNAFHLFSPIRGACEMCFASIYVLPIRFASRQLKSTTQERTGGWQTICATIEPSTLQARTAESDVSALPQRWWMMTSLSRKIL